MNKDSERSLQNFAKALGKLESFLRETVSSERDRAGVIQAFEFSFELAWKTVQKLSESHSKQVGSPKQAFQIAFQLGWIAEGEHGKWLQMVADRNLTSHTYDETLADEILGRIRGAHLSAMKQLHAAMSREHGSLI